MAGSDFNPPDRFFYPGDSRGTPFNRYWQCLQKIPDVTLDGFDPAGRPWTLLFKNLTAVQEVKPSDKVVWYSGNAKAIPSQRLRWNSPIREGILSGTVACRTGETMFKIYWY